MLIKREAQQSRSDTPTLGNEFDVQGARAEEPRGMDPRLEMLMNSLSQQKPKPQGMDPRLRLMEPQQSKAPDVEITPREAIKSTMDTFRGLDSSNTMDANLEEGNIVDVIQDRLEKLINVSGDQPEVPPALDRRMMSNTPKFDTNTDIGELANLFNFPPNTTIGDDLGGRTFPLLVRNFKVYCKV